MNSTTHNGIKVFIISHTGLLQSRIHNYRIERMNDMRKKKAYSLVSGTFRKRFYRIRGLRGKQSDELICPTGDVGTLRDLQSLQNTSLLTPLKLEGCID